jgi:hypothetical protein
MKMPLRRLLTFVFLGVWIWFIGCGGGGGGSTSSTSGSSSNSTPAPVTLAQNAQSIVVNGGPTADSIIYPNAAFTSVTICVPGTSNCQTIEGVLVDTGSSGLRLLSSAVTLPLPAQTSNGNQLAECLQFFDSYVWGPVKLADVKLADETASSVPIQVLDHNFTPVPSDWPPSNSGSEADDLGSLGANGILGIGQYQEDCGTACASGVSPSTSNITYYECSSSAQPVFVSLSKQVQNPVGLFPVDNNGVIIRMPAVSGSGVNVTGSMIFGIGTQSNNGLGSATVFTLNPYSSITTNYKSQPMTYSFIDSGSNGYFFPDASIPNCSSYTGFYCPATSLNLSAINLGGNGSSSTVAFIVDSASTLFSGTIYKTAYSNLAGPNDFSNNSQSLQSFDWGLPFFYGRSVYTAIEGKNTPAGPGPYWAY